MNPALALLVWFVILLIIFFIFWWFAGYGGWQSFVIAVLLALIVLLALFPWNFEHHHQDPECEPWGRGIFFAIVLISITILVIYIIATYIWSPAVIVEPAPVVVV